MEPYTKQVIVVATELVKHGGVTYHQAYKLAVKIQNNRIKAAKINKKDYVAQ